MKRLETLACLSYPRPVASKQNIEIISTLKLLEPQIDDTKMMKAYLVIPAGAAPMRRCFHSNSVVVALSEAQTGYDTPTMLEILYADDHLVAVDKLPGLL